MYFHSFCYVLSLIKQYVKPKNNSKTTSVFVCYHAISVSNIRRIYLNLYLVLKEHSDIYPQKIFEYETLGSDCQSGNIRTIYITNQDGGWDLSPDFLIFLSFVPTILCFIQDSCLRRSQGCFFHGMHAFNDTLVTNICSIHV